MRVLAATVLAAGVAGAFVDPGAEVLPGPRVRLVEADGLAGSGGDAASGADAGSAGRPGTARSRAARSALPVPATLVDRGDLAAPHHDYPAVDLLVPEGTPVLAPRGGWARRHRGERCGLGVTVTGTRGHRWVLCHLSVVSVPPRSRVRAGDVLGLSGDTGNARGIPHLHVHLRAPDGSYRCPQPLLVAWYEGRERPPWDAPDDRWGDGRRCWFTP